MALTDEEVIVLEGKAQLIREILSTVLKTQLITGTSMRNYI
jgi:hypothetical protein